MDVSTHYESLYFKNIDCNTCRVKLLTCNRKYKWLYMDIPIIYSRFGIKFSLLLHVCTCIEPDIAGFFAFSTRNLKKYISVSDSMVNIVIGIWQNYMYICVQEQFPIFGWSFFISELSEVECLLFVSTVQNV